MKTIQYLFCCGVVLFTTIKPSKAKEAVLPTPVPTTAEASAERFVELFKPFRTDQAALSPDGKYIAYSIRENEELSVAVVEIDNPGKMVGKVTVISDQMATPLLNVNSVEKTPAKIRWMRWATPTRLLLETNRNFPYNLQIGDEGTWFNCAGEIIGFDADGKNAKSLVTPMDVAEWDASDGIKNNLIPRSPHIVDFHPTESGSVIIQADGVPRANGARYIERYRLDATTGKLRSMEHYSPPIDNTFLFDRVGVPRIALTVSTRDAFPHHFLYNAGSTLSHWKKLDQYATSPTEKGFIVSPENYFGERAIPLGFDLAGSVLYFASNVGRDTYGVYGLDLKQWKRTEFKAESPLYDLFVPTPGVFPDTNGGAMLVRDEVALSESNWEPPLPITSEPAEDPSGQGRSQAIRQQEADDKRKDDANSKSSQTEFIQRIKVQLRTGSLVGNVNESPLVYDRYGHDVVGIRYEGKTHTVLWFKPEVKQVQDEVERLLPGRSVDVLDWDSTANRFLIRTRGQMDSGAFHVFDKAKTRLAEFVVRAPWLDREKLHQTNDFIFHDPSGRSISGTFTYPRIPRTLPVPIVVLCSSVPWERIHADFRPDLHALADMGFAVLQINARGCWGFGTKNRQAIGDGFEESLVADICSAIEVLSKRYAISSKRVALFGKNLGGYIALRALQIAPTRFKCAVALDTEVDIKSWIDQAHWGSSDAGPALVGNFFGDPEKLKESPLLSQTNKITAAILACNYRGVGGEQETSTHVNARRLVSAVGGTSELFDLSDDYMAGLPQAKAETFQKIEEFLNTNIYNFQVKPGELKELKD